MVNFVYLFRQIFDAFLMAIYTWTHLLQCIVVVRSFLRMLKLRKLSLEAGAVLKCQGVLDYGLNYGISL